MSFLFFYVVLAELFLGSLLALCFRALIRPNWIEPLVPAFTSLQRLKFVLPPLFLVLVWRTPDLYPWARSAAEAPTFRALYLSRTGFLLRGVVYWGMWSTLSHFALRKKAWTGGPGVVVLLFTASLASVDWVLSLDETLASTIFGLIFLVSSLLLSFGFAAFFANGEGEKPQARRDQSSVHFALVCVWTYLSVMQLMVIWAGNRPDEAHWYLQRIHHGWQIFPVIFGLLQFFVPFLLLLQSPVKRSEKATRALALASFCWQVLFCFWQIAPAFHERLIFDLPLGLAFAGIAASVAFLGRGLRAERV